MHLIDQNNFTEFLKKRPVIYKHSQLYLYTQNHETKLILFPIINMDLFHYTKNNTFSVFFYDSQIQSNEEFRCLLS